MFTAFYVLRLLQGACCLLSSAAMARQVAEADIATNPLVAAAPAGPGANAGRGTSWLGVQIALARIGYSCGSIDGLGGPQTTAALKAYQRDHQLVVSGIVDAETSALLTTPATLFENLTVSPEAVAQLQPLSSTWLGKSQQTRLGYETVLEWASEWSHATPTLLRQLNPNVDWAAIRVGTQITVPSVRRTATHCKAASLHLQLSAHVVEAWDASGKVIAHFPISIARLVEKRPEGVLHVTALAANPDYTFEPDLFPESDEARALGHRLRIPPGPNNPVGVAWIGLDLPGYGIHGSPTPETIGRTESHGCFRLANWDALALLDLAWVGLPVFIDS